jgi:hypothetical protein
MSTIELIQEYKALAARPVPRRRAQREYALSRLEREIQRRAEERAVEFGISVRRSAGAQGGKAL